MDKTIDWQPCDCPELNAAKGHAMYGWLVLHQWEYDSSKYGSAAGVCMTLTGEADMEAFTNWALRNGVVVSSHPQRGRFVSCVFGRLEEVLQLADQYNKEHAPDWGAILADVDER